MSHITSISLDPEAAELAQRMKREGKNFSRFVRECLFVYYSEEQTECTDNAPWVIHGCGSPDVRLCRPSRRYPCRRCWPKGIPHQQDWKAARAHIGQVSRKRADKYFSVEETSLIPELCFRDEKSVLWFDEELKVIDWLKKQAADRNQFIMPLADLELKGNEKSKAVKTEKPRKGILKRILSELGR